MNKRLGCAIIGILVVALIVWAATTGDTAGVLLANEIPERAFAQARSDGIGQDEDILVLSEVSLGSLSEYAVITNRRLVYVKDGRTTEIAHGDLASTEIDKGFLEANVIAKSKSGRTMKISMLPGDEDLFLKMLEEQRAIAQAGTPSSATIAPDASAAEPDAGSENK